MNSRLVDLTGTLLFNRIFAVVLGLLFLGLTLWRFSMTERAPSKRGCAGSPSARRAKRKLAAVPRQLGGEPVFAPRRATVARHAVPDPPAGRGPAGADQPGPDRPHAARDRLHRRWCCGSRSRPTARPITRPSRRRSPAVTGGSALFLLMIAAFYGGELVWRERDRKLNELIDSTAGAELGDDRPEDPRDLPHPADRQSRRRADRHRLPADRGRARRSASRNISAGSSSRPRSTAC